jgi:organic radical activating enzyme
MSAQDRLPGDELAPSANEVEEPCVTDLEEERAAERAARRRAIAAERAADREFSEQVDAAARAPLHEIFTSIQGEALFAGLQQIFVRFRGCDLGCPWCDTPAAHGADPEADCRAQSRPGVRGWTIPNPVGVADVAHAVERILRANEPGAVHSISLTGGEPLLHAEFVAALAVELRRFELPIMLETNGQRPAELRRVLRVVDWVAADYKLDSAMGRPLDGAARREFLRLAQHQRAFVKLVLTDAATEEELRGAFAEIAEVDRAAPVFLQPVTPVGDIRPPRGIDLIRFRALAIAAGLRDVRVMPQVHRLLGLA